MSAVGALVHAAVMAPQMRRKYLLTMHRRAMRSAHAHRVFGERGDAAYYLGKAAGYRRDLAALGC